GRLPEEEGASLPLGRALLLGGRGQVGRRPAPPLQERRPGRDEAQGVAVVVRPVWRPA
ncbi:unnamed protein product, partial [Prorocentrum cordatum]